MCHFGSKSTKTLSSITVLFFKSNTIKSKNTIESIYSRETIFLVQNILFIVIAAITLWGTIYPVISDLFFGQIVTVGEPFYDKMNGPLMLLLIAIMGIAPLFPWKKGSNIKIAKNLITPAIIGLLPMAIMLAIGFSKIITLFGVWIFGIAATIIIRELINGTISINKKYQSKYKGIYSNNEIDEMFGAMADTIASLTNKKYGYGHKKSYFASGRGAYRRFEYFAHQSENYWLGNPVFEDHFPELYDLMIKQHKKLLGL